MGKIRAVCISREKGTPKENVGSGMLVEGFGLEGDAHGGNWHRQVSLLSGDKIDEFRKKIWKKRNLSPKKTAAGKLSLRLRFIGCSAVRARRQRR